MLLYVLKFIIGHAISYMVRCYCKYKQKADYFYQPFIFTLCVCMFCLHVCVCTCVFLVPMESEEDVGFPGTRLSGGCELPCGVWELNSNYLQ